MRIETEHKSCGRLRGMAGMEQGRSAQEMAGALRIQLLTSSSNCSGRNPLTVLLCLLGCHNLLHD